MNATNRWWIDPLDRGHYYRRQTKIRQKPKRGKNRQRRNHTAVGLRLTATVQWQSLERTRAWDPRTERFARNRRVSGVMQRRSTRIVHARRGAVAFVHVRRIRGSVPRCRGKRSPLRHGALGAGDDGIPPAMGALPRAGGIATRLRRDSEGARIEAGNAARNGLRRGTGRFL